GRSQGRTRPRARRGGPASQGEGRALMGRTIRLSRLLEGAGIRPQAPVGPDPEITGVGLDSRAVREGDLFFALRGARADGESFVPQAVERGARAGPPASAPSAAAPAR